MTSFFSKPINSLLLAQNKCETLKKKNINILPLKKQPITPFVSLVIIKKQG
jgi:hypothetical protein